MMDISGKASQYAVVLFLPRKASENTVELVPLSWTFDRDNEPYCYFPPSEDYGKIANWLASLEPPNKDWEVFPVEILSYACDYKQGKRRLRRSFKEATVEASDAGMSDNCEGAVMISKSAVISTLKNIPSLPARNLQQNATMIQQKENVPPNANSFDPLFEFINEKLEKMTCDICMKIENSKRSILYDIDKKIDNLKSILVNCDEARQRSTFIDAKKALDTSLPIGTLEEFLIFDQKLVDDPNEREALICFYRLLAISERTVQNCITKIFPATIIKTVELNYSGTGKKIKGIGKLNFSETNTFACMKDVLIEKFTNSDDMRNFAGKIGRWLSGAPDRDGGRKERSQQGASV